MAKIPRVPVDNQITTLSVGKIAIKFSPSSALQCKVQSSIYRKVKVKSKIIYLYFSIEKFHWSKKLRNIQNFSFYLNIKSTNSSRQLISTCYFVSWGHFDNGMLHKVTHNFHMKIRNILALTTCPVKFETTCPSVIFLLATGSQPPCLRYLCCWLAHVFGKRIPFKIV